MPSQHTSYKDAQRTLGKKYELMETFSKEMGNKKENQLEMKDIVTEMKNTLQDINSEVYEAEYQTRDLEDKETE